MIQPMVIDLETVRRERSLLGLQWRESPPKQGKYLRSTENMQIKSFNFSPSGLCNAGSLVFGGL